MDERDIKRMPIVVPRELYERFQACSRDENKTNTAMVLEWMKNYVKEKEQKIEREQALLALCLRVGKIVDDIAPCLEKTDPKRPYVKDLAKALQELGDNVELLDDTKFEANLVLIEQALTPRRR